ncbi:Uncharacterized protein APZ42_028130 [Daphnia magna]|uniref:Uncharacterized protein n=1 Tax=Daphnia magna TaxID=35525 RepID=A0A164QUS8_9CRUS|nr:Uncharacterized protein APZ42_028130 [Daphnia magna]
MMAARALPVASKRSSRAQQKAARSLGSLKRSQDMDNSFTVLAVDPSLLLSFNFHLYFFSSSPRAHTPWRRMQIEIFFISTAVGVIETAPMRSRKKLLTPSIMHQQVERAMNI